MTVKIKGGTTADISVDKALSRTQGNSFELKDVSPIVERQTVKPGLLTAMLGANINTEFLTTDKFAYDEITHTMQLPDAKSYNDFGPRITKDKARELTFRVGSFGLSANVPPEDYAGRRMPDTEELMTEAYLVSQINDKMTAGWDAFTELAIAQLLTTDTNINRGDTTNITQYNYYTEIVGSSRPAATSMDLSGAVDHYQLLSDQKDLLETDMEKAMMSSSEVVVICGKTFFDQRLLIEKQNGLGGGVNLSRELRSGLDLASMGVPEDAFGSGSGRFNYQFFTSAIDGLTYVKYAASIQGSKLIADTAAYMIPVGAESFLRMVYAPARTKQYVNTVAQSRYGWSDEDDRNGVTLWTESNVLPFNAYPELVRHLTV